MSLLHSFNMEYFYFAAKYFNLFIHKAFVTEFQTAGLSKSLKKDIRMTF